MVNPEKPFDGGGRIFEQNVLIKFGPDFGFMLGRGDENEVIHVHYHFGAKRGVIEDAGGSFPDRQEAANTHNLVHFFVPNRPAFGVAVEGTFEDTNWVFVFGSAIGVEPRFGPKEFGQSNPCSGASWGIDERLNICLLSVTC